MMVKIGYLMHGISYGGASRSLYLLLKGMKNINYNAEIIIYTISVHSQDILNQFKKYVCEIKLVDLKTLYINQTHKDSYVTYLKRKNANIDPFINLVIKDKLDILHINTSVFPHILKPLKEKTKIKLVLHDRELIPPYGTHFLANYMLTEITKYSDALICISNNEGSRFKNVTPYIIPNPFDFSKVNNIYSTWKHDNDISEKTIVVSMFSNFFFLKGHITFLKALKALKNMNPGYSFVFAIVGVKHQTKLYRRIIKKILLKTDYRSQVLRYIKNNNLSKDVVLQAYTNDVFSIYDGSDIIVRPALTADPWGRDIIEAMALRKPVIATGESDFFIKNGETGFLVPPNNPLALAEKIKELITNKSKRELFGKNGYNRIKQLCEINNHAKSVALIYKNLKTPNAC